MSVTVWKFQWPGGGTLASFEMPKGAEIIHVNAQFECPCLWARVDPDAIKERRIFALVGTGHPCPPAPAKHVGSFFMNGGQFVFHIFEEPSP